jgi:hypothetical protein
MNMDITVDDKSDYDRKTGIVSTIATVDGRPVRCQMESDFRKALIGHFEESGQKVENAEASIRLAYPLFSRKISTDKYDDADRGVITLTMNDLDDIIGP